MPGFISSELKSPRLFVHPAESWMRSVERRLMIFSLLGCELVGPETLAMTTTINLTPHPLAGSIILSP
jgi:hypothetical protein